MGNTRVFNRICAGLAVVWLVTLLPLTEIRRTNLRGAADYRDFAYLYRSGLVAQKAITHGERWDLLYPISRDGSADMKAAYNALADDVGVDDTWPYMQAPPNALLYWPLSYLSYRVAHLAWIVLQSLCAWGVAMLAGHTLSICLGRPTKWAGALTLVVAVSALMYYSIGVGNISPLIALLMGSAVVAMARRDSPLTGAGIAFGTISKQAPAVLLPLAIAMGRWRMVATWAVASAAIIVASVAAMGGEPFSLFFRLVVPVLGRSMSGSGNQSISGMLLRAIGQPNLPAAAQLALTALELGVLGLVLVTIFTRPRGFWKTPAHVFAAGAAMICWILIFSPIAWYHYYLYLMPLWGWLAWEGTQSKPRAVAAGVAGLLVWYPFFLHRRFSPGHYLPEPVGSHMLVSVIIVFVLAMRRLVSSRPA